MIEDAKSFQATRVHLIIDFVLSLFVTAAANVEILAQKLLAAVAMHVYIG